MTPDLDEEKRFWQSLAGLPGAQQYLVGMFEERIKVLDSDIAYSCKIEEIPERRAFRDALREFSAKIKSKITNLKTTPLHHA